MKSTNKPGRGIAFGLLLFLLIPAGGAFACGGSWDWACGGWWCEDRNNLVFPICVPCGAPWEGACWSAPGCDSWTNNIFGICTPCGGGWQGVCWGGAPCNSGNDNIIGICTPSCGQWSNNIGNVLIGNWCVSCGDSWQGMCLVGAPCKDRNNNVAGWCTPCGGSGELVCLSGAACDPGYRIVAGFCSYSGFSEEPTTNVTNLPDLRQAGSGSDPVRGIADVHTHMFANLAFGGVMFWGSPFDWRGINSALAWCDYTWDFATQFLSVPLLPGPLGYDVHGPQGPTQLVSGPVSHIMDGRCDPEKNPSACVTGHAVGGTGLFDGWPRYDSYTHQQMYHTWVKRAYEGGVRLMVMFPINSEALCLSQKQRWGWDCDDMKAVDRQIQAAKDLEWAIDWLDDNQINGSGWYRIAYSPQQARQIIREGKMAVVLGIEVDSLFNCKFGLPCPKWYREEQMEKYYKLGVRHVYPIHHYDNAFGGSAIFLNLLNIGSVVITGHQPVVRDCSHYDCLQGEKSYLDGEKDGHHDGSCGYTYNVGPDPFNVIWEIYNDLFGTQLPDLSYYNQFDADCNFFGLSDTGRGLIEELMEHKFIIDTDHMSRVMIDEVLQMARTRKINDIPRPYPLVSSHTWFRDLNPDTDITAPLTDDYRKEFRQKKEFSLTDGQIAIFKEIGGLITAINPKTRCGTSTSYRDILKYGVDRMRKDENDKFPGVAFSTDFHGFAEATGPRFGPEACTPGTESTRLLYGFTGLFGGQFHQQVTGQRSFDFNTQGMAHYGLIPDFFADLKAQGMTDDELEPLLNSAEAYIRVWETIDNIGKFFPPPTVAARVNGTLGLNGWYTSDVTVEWDVTPASANDPIASSTGCDAITITTDTAGLTLQCVAVTQNGASSSAEVTVRRDTVPPAFTAVKKPAEVWTNKPVQVTFEATDATSGLAGAASAEVIVDMEGGGLTASYTFADRAGLTTNAVLGDINIDRTPPNVGFAFAPPVVISTPADLEAELQRWHNADVVFDVMATDTLSGIAALSPSRLILGADGAAVGGSVFAVDKAGNSITVFSPLVKIDKTPPTIGLSIRTPLPNTYGWNNSDVTVRWTCGDALSGVIVAEVSQTVSTEGAAQSAQGTCTDLAGNTASATASGINIDKSTPSVSGTIATPPNANGWYNSDVTVAFSCTDSLSGLVSCGPSPQVISAEGVNLFATGVAVDRAGNTASTTVGGEGSGITIKIDKTPPSITCSSNPAILWPPNHKLVDVRFTANVSDSLSGSNGFTLISATSNEPDNGLGDGDTGNDIQGFVIGTADSDGQLRAERSGAGNGRVYTLSYQGMDKAGNTSTCATTVTVPHDQAKK